VQVEDDWCEGACSVDVLPRWYWITHLAARDIGSLRGVRLEELIRPSTTTAPTAHRPEVPNDTLPTILVIDAGAQWVDPQRSWYHTLRSTHPRIDSVEADRKVWVYRFRR
jgi:hypothetical protein